MTLILHWCVCLEGEEDSGACSGSSEWPSSGEWHREPHTVRDRQTGQECHTGTHTVKKHRTAHNNT